MNMDMREQPFKRATFTPESIAELTSTLKARPWRLLQSEILQILNHVPMAVPEIKLLLEDFDERFKEQEQEDLLQVIHRIMKVHP